MGTIGTFNKELIFARDAFYGQGADLAPDRGTTYFEEVGCIPRNEKITMCIKDKIGDSNVVEHYCAELLNGDDKSKFEYIQCMPESKRVRSFRQLAMDVETGKYTDKEMEEVEKLMAALVDVASAQMVRDGIDCHYGEKEL